MKTQTIKLNVENRIALLTVDRPEKLNTLHAEAVTELFQNLKKLKQNEEVAVIIITGSGEKSFVAGADVKEIKEHDEITGRIFSSRGQKVFRYIEKMEKPVIAAINGVALGAGLELAMACHLRIASKNARFGLPEINLGLIPGYGGTQRTPRLIGLTNAFYLLLTGDIIDAKKALELGLINEVVAPEKLLARASEIATSLVKKPPIAVRYLLQAVSDGIDKNLDTALNLENELFGNICATADMKEGTTAFLEKREANFKGK